MPYAGRVQSAVGAPQADSAGAAVAGAVVTGAAAPGSSPNSFHGYVGVSMHR